MFEFLLFTQILVFVFLIFSILFAAILQRKDKNKTVKKDNKKCSIILPCKGLNPTLKDNIASFFTLDHSNYEVLLVVESETDTAVPVIKEVIADKPNGKLVVAGLTKGCCQKNHNLIAAVKETEKAHFLVFADSDIKLYPSWLSAITTPLSDEKLTAVSGFRWLYSTSRNPLSHIHAFQNFVLFGLFTVASRFFNRGLWGGSTAIRKKDYDDLHVEQRWAETGVDDLALSELLYKMKKKTYLSFDCITPTDETINSFTNVTKWYKRQTMYLKIHQRGDWYLALLMATTILLSYMVIPYALYIALVKGSIPCTIQAIPTMLGSGLITLGLLFPLLGKTKHPFSFLLFTPLSMVSVILAVLSTIFTNKIDWSGYRYTVNPKNGIVTNIETIE